MLQTIMDFIYSFSISFLRRFNKSRYENETVFSVSNLIKKAERKIKLSQMLDYGTYITNIEKIEALRTYIIKTRRAHKGKGFFMIYVKDNSLNAKWFEHLSEALKSNKKALFFIKASMNEVKPFLTYLKRIIYDANIISINKKLIGYRMEDFQMLLEKEAVKITNHDGVETVIGIDMLQRAVKGGIEEADMYILRKFLDKYYSILPLDNLSELVDSDEDTIIITRDELENNIIPPTEIFSKEDKPAPKIGKIENKPCEVLKIKSVKKCVKSFEEIERKVKHIEQDNPDLEIDYKNFGFYKDGSPWIIQHHRII